jgi:hypothetical protein
MVVLFALSVAGGCGGPDDGATASNGAAGVSGVGAVGGTSAGVGGASAGAAGQEPTGGGSAGQAATGGAPGSSGTGGASGSAGAQNLGTGIPYGPYGLWSSWSAIETVGTSSFDMSMGSVSATQLVQQIDTARGMQLKMTLAMTGGAHANYLTNGVFDYAKWKAKMDTYDTPAIKAAVAAGVKDGTIVGNSVMDEPHVHGTGDGNTWGPVGTMTKTKVDGLCAYVKAMFPTLPVGVAHGHAVFEPDKSYQVCEFIMDQYSARKGDVAEFRDAGLALGKRDGHAIMFSMNILDGGIQAEKDGTWNCPLSTTGGRGTYEPNCRMTAKQVRDFGKTLGVAGCAMTMWRYDEAFMANSANQQAFQDVADLLATKPRTACRRP